MTKIHNVCGCHAGRVPEYPVMHVAAIAVQGCSCWSKAVPDVAWPPSPNGCKYIAPSETIEIVENYAMPCNAKVYIGSLVFRQTALCRSSSPQGTSPCWEAETKQRNQDNISMNFDWRPFLVWIHLMRHNTTSIPFKSFQLIHFFISLHFTAHHCTPLHSFALIAYHCTALNFIESEHFLNIFPSTA